MACIVAALPFTTVSVTECTVTRVLALEGTVSFDRPEPVPERRFWPNLVFGRPSDGDRWFVLFSCCWRVSWGPAASWGRRSDRSRTMGRGGPREGGKWGARRGPLVGCVKRNLAGFAPGSFRNLRLLVGHVQRLHIAHTVMIATVQALATALLKFGLYAVQFRALFVQLKEIIALDS